MLCAFDHQGLTYAVIHGGVRDVARFIWSVSAPEVFNEELRALEAEIGQVDVVIAGHSGIAFERAMGDTRWINAGVIGMPAHCGTQETEYLRISPQGAAQICKLTYDVEGAVQDMVEVGLTQGYHTSLHSGYWPSEDVLPDALRRVDGQSDAGFAKG